MNDRDILRQASDNSDEWSDETWAAWGRLADQAHGHESGPALKPMSPDCLAEIAARAEAATPGPWRTELDHCDCDPDYGCAHPPFAVAFGPFSSFEHSGDRHHYDAEFSAHARTDVPALLDEVERLRAERDRYRSAWRSARFRAEARGEGILREAKNRDFWQEEAHRLNVELAARPTRNEAVREAANLLVGRLADSLISAPEAWTEAMDDLPF